MFEGIAIPVCLVCEKSLADSQEASNQFLEGVIFPL
jgi:hypothetical protein